MMTTLAFALLLAGPPVDWSDPFVPAAPPVDRWAAYWPAHAVDRVVACPPTMSAANGRCWTTPAATKPVPPLPAHRLTRADFTDAPKPRALTATDARAQAEAMNAELAADAAVYLVLSNKRDRAVVLSAMLCEARERRDAAAEKNRSGTLDRPLALAYVHAVETVEAAELRLAVLDVQPLSCNLWPVARVVQCLSIAPPIECESNAELAAQVRAADRLAGTP